MCILNQEACLMRYSVLWYMYFALQATEHSQPMTQATYWDSHLCWPQKIKLKMQNEENVQKINFQGFLESEWFPVCKWVSYNKLCDSAGTIMIHILNYIL